MLNYNPKWNRGGEQKDIILHVEGLTIATRKFIDEDEFHKVYRELIIEKDRWNSSDQFVGEHLEIFVP